MYTANANRYRTMQYKRVGNSGLKLPYVSLGLWHNFGSLFPHANSREMILGAFDLGITHFDLANNYGPVPGSAEETFGRVLSQDLKAHRDELIISTKSGYYMWEGPYGEWGSRKQMLASLDQSLVRMGLDYVDIFYSHRPDEETPLEETMSALAQMALSWLHISPVTASVIIGASRLSQIEGCVGAQHSAPFTPEELRAIDKIVLG